MRHAWQTVRLQSQSAGIFLDAFFMIFDSKTSEVAELGELAAATVYLPGERGGRHG